MSTYRVLTPIYHGDSIVSTFLNVNQEKALEGVFSVIVELKLGKCPHLCALVEVVAAGLRLGVGSVAARAAAAEGADGVDAEAVRAQIRAQRALVNIPPQRTQTLVHTQLPANIDNFWLLYLYQNNHLFRKYPSQN